MLTTQNSIGSYLGSYITNGLREGWIGTTGAWNVGFRFRVCGLGSTSLIDDLKPADGRQEATLEVPR